MYRNYKNIYFLGIGGVGMSGLAGWLHQKKYNVGGYDRSSNYYTLKLKKKGVDIINQLLIDQIPKIFLNNSTTLVIYTPAIKKDHKFLSFFKKKNFKIIKRSELLSYIAKDYNVIAISGTHGKTTISVMLSHILVCAGYSPSAFFGGISKNYNNNFLIGNSKYMIIEADEYDKSFLNLNPIKSVVTSLDKDHLDTYNTHNDMLEAFCEFYLNTKKSSENLDKYFFIDSNAFILFKTHVQSRDKLGYGPNLSLDQSVHQIKTDVDSINEARKKFILNKMCDHNIKNAIIASEIANSIGLSQLQISNAFQKYLGIKRRFEYHLNTNKCILIDDYAHHPKELESLIKSLRALYPKRKLFLIFQPHLFSRTKDLAKEFCDVLELADKIGILDIYTAREKPIEGVSSKKLLKNIKLKNKWYINDDNIDGILKKELTDLIVTAGAGDIYNLLPRIKKILK
jgi:UDP-N-acetylmuramate--alanine ligase